MDKPGRPPSEDLREVLANIARKLKNQVEPNKLIIDDSIIELSEIRGFADYLFSDQTITLLTPAITFERDGKTPRIHIDASVSVFGYDSLVINVDILLIDERFALRSSIYLPSDIKLGIPGISWFSVQKISLQAEVWLDTGAFTIHLDGDLHANTSKLPSSLHLPVHQSDFQLVVQGPVPIDFHEAANWFSNQELTQGWPNFVVSSIDLKNLTLSFNPGKARIDLFSVKIVPSDPKQYWQIIPGLVELRFPVATLACINMTSGDRSFSGEISGIVRLIETDIFVSASKNKAGNWLYEGWTLPEVKIQLSSLLKECIPETFPLPAEIPDLSFSQLGISISASNKSMVVTGTANTDQEWCIPFPGLGSLSIHTLSLRMSLEAGKDSDRRLNASCSITGKGTLNLVFGATTRSTMSGDITFHTARTSTGFNFSSDNPDKSIVTLPLGPEKGPSLTYQMTLIDLSHGQDGWALKAETETQLNGLPAFMTRPIPGAEVSIVPEAPRKWALEMGKSTFLLSADRLWDGPPLQIVLPKIHIEGSELSLGTLTIDVEKWQVGLLNNHFELQTTFIIAVSEEINRIFGVDKQSTKPKHKILLTYDAKSSKPLEKATKIQFGVSEKSGIWAFPKNSPFVNMQPDERGFYHIGLGEKDQFGKVALKMPTFSFGPSGWSASGQYHINEPLSLPLSIFKSLLTSTGLGVLAEVLPYALPIMDIQLVKDNKLNFMNWLSDISVHSNIKIPATVRDGLKKLEAISDDLLKKTPGCLNEYFSFSMPKDLAFEIQTGAGASFDLKISTETEDGKPGNPIRLLMPLFNPTTGMPELVGVQLHSISVGEILGGSLFPVSIDAKIDRFDLLTLVACVMEGSLADKTTSTSKYQNRVILSEVLAVLPAGTPFPIPLFYKHLGWSYFGWEMMQIESHFKYPLPEVGLLESLTLFKTLKNYFIFKDNRLPETAPQGFDLPFTVGQNFLRLPTWLGGGMLGTDKDLPELNIWRSLASLLNGLKFGDPQDFLNVLPVQARIMLVDVNFAFLDVEVGAAVTTPEEFRTRIMKGKIDTKPGRRFGEYLKQMGDGPDKQIESLLPKNPDQPTNTNGLIVLLLSEFDIASILRLNLAFGLTAVSSEDTGRSFATGVRFAGRIGDTLQLAICGSLLITKEQMTIDGDSGIWWNDEPLTEEELTTVVTDSSFETEVTLNFSDRCTLSGKWLITQKAISLSGELSWEYMDEKYCKARLQGSFSNNGITLHLEEEQPEIYGLAIEDLALLIPATAGSRMSINLRLSIPNELSSALNGQITQMAIESQNALKNAAKIAVEELQKLKNYEISVDGISRMMDSICQTIVQQINKHIKERSKAERWAIRNRVKQYTDKLNSYAKNFERKPDKNNLSKQIDSLLRWATKNRDMKIPLLPLFTVIDDETLKTLKEIQAKAPGWIVHLPAHNIDLTLSSRNLKYTENSVHQALYAIAENIGKKTAKIPRLKTLSVTSGLNVLPQNKEMHITVTRNNVEKDFIVRFDFTAPVNSVPALAEQIRNELVNW